MVWKHESDVMLGHFERRRKLKLPPYRNTNLPTCLSTWYRWFLERVCRARHPRARHPPRALPPQAATRRHTPPPLTPRLMSSVAPLLLSG